MRSWTGWKAGSFGIVKGDMTVAQDIVRTYRATRDTIARRIGVEVREDKAFAVLLGGCCLVLIAQLPKLARDAHLNELVTFDELLAGAIFAWLFVAPVLFYALTFVVQGLLMIIGRKVNGYSLRMALFWGLLAATPMFLFWGLTAGFVGPGPAKQIVGALALGALIVFWVSGIVLLAARPHKSEG